MEDLRQQARNLVQDIVNHMGNLLTFTENAVNTEQLDRIIDVMDTVRFNATNIINLQQQQPPPPPGNLINEDDAESGITHE